MAQRIAFLLTFGGLILIFSVCCEFVKKPGQAAHAFSALSIIITFLGPSLILQVQNRQDFGTPRTEISNVSNNYLKNVIQYEKKTKFFKMYSKILYISDRQFENAVQEGEKYSLKLKDRQTRICILFATGC